MIEIRKKLKTSRTAYGIQAKGRLQLPFELRRKTPPGAQLASGEAVELRLPRGEVLRGGDLLVASDGRIIEVLAQPEQVLHVTFARPEDLARAAYHLGRRAVPLEVGEGFLRLADAPELRDMLAALGATVTAMEAPFEPDTGAEGEAEAHAHADGHDHAHEHEHDHDHDHAHDHHDCGHDHAHDHQHEHHDCGHDHAHDHDKKHDHEDCGHDHAHGHHHKHE